MKRQFLFLLLVFLYSKGMPQNIGNDVLAISASKMLVVYVNLDNPLTVAVPGVSPEKISVIASFGTLTGSKGNYILNIPSKDFPKEITLKIYQGTNPEDRKEIATQMLRVKMVPKPLVTLGNFEGGEISVKDVKSLDAVNVILKDFYFDDLGYLVKSFKFYYVPQDTINQRFLIFNSTSNLLTPEMKTTLSNPKVRDKIIISEIMVTFPGSKEILIPSTVSLKITD